MDKNGHDGRRARERRKIRTCVGNRAGSRRFRSCWECGVCGMGWGWVSSRSCRWREPADTTAPKTEEGVRVLAKKQRRFFPASVRINEGRQTRESFRERHKSEFGRSSVARWLADSARSRGEEEGARRGGRRGEVGKEEGKKECAAEQQNQGVGVSVVAPAPPGQWARVWPGWVTVTLAGARRMGRGPGRFSLVGCGHGKGGPHQGGPAQAGTGAEGR